MALFRATGMKSLPGQEAQFDQVMGNPGDLSGVEGLLFMGSAQPTSGATTACMIFASSAHCESFKTNMRAKMMEKMKGSAGPPTYMVEAPLQKQWSSGKKIAPGMALRNVGFKCKPGKETAFTSMASGIYDAPAPAGLVFRAYTMSDSRTMNSVSIFESMAALDAYNTEVRAKYAAQMGEMMEGPVYDEKGTIKTAMGPKGDGGDACCAGCVVS